MNRSFEQLIADALRNELSAEASFTGVFPDSPFPVLQVEKLPVAIHCISLDLQKLKPLPPDFFALKSAEADLKGILLIHLWEDVFYRQKELVLSRLGTLLGLNRKLHGRQCRVERIGKKAADDFLNANHLLHTATARYKYGLFYHDKLVAAATFSSGKTFDKNIPQKRSHELVRFASLPGNTVTGGLSKLIRRFADDVQPGDIMTYADRDWSAGKSYHKTGFILETATPPQRFFIHPEEMLRYYAQRLPASFTTEFSTSGFAGMDSFLGSKGYFCIYNSGNLKFRLTF